MPVSILTLDISNARHYIRSMINTWNDEAARELFEREKAKAIPQNILKVALRKLRMLNAATKITDLSLVPGNSLNQHDRGRFAGKWSIRINDQWRLFFRWENGSAYEVEISDYHKHH